MTKKIIINCGNCNKWMKSRMCPREKNVNGRNKGPGRTSWPCKDFEPTWNDLMSILKGELV